MSLINVNNVTFGYEGSAENVFENVSFQLDTSWKTGFVGRNGRGKTTFLRLLQGELEYSGAISASVDFRYFPVPVIDKNISVIEILENISTAPQWQILRELSLLGVEDEMLYREFGTLSGGEQTKVLLAALFAEENGFLLIDEPTNHLDAEGRRLLSEYLNTKRGFILVSHDRRFLDNCVDHIISINRVDIEVQKGNFSSWYENRERQNAFELAENEKLKKEAARLTEALREKSTWSDRAEKSKIGFDPRKTEKSMGRRPYEGAKSKKLMKQAKVYEARQQAALEEKSGLLKNIEATEIIKINPREFHSEKIAELQNISVFYGEKAAVQNVSFTVKKGDRIALRGRNGSGKTSILRLLRGEEMNFSGGLQIPAGLEISFVSQDTSALRGTPEEYAEALQIDLTLFNTILRKLNFPREHLEKNIAEYSAGQKKKVLLAASFASSAHLYLWDEPLNYVDIISRRQIEEAIIKYCPTMVFVEHDLAFTEAVATEIIEISE